MKSGWREIVAVFTFEFIVCLTAFWFHWDGRATDCPLINRRKISAKFALESGVKPAFLDISLLTC